VIDINPIGLREGRLPACVFGLFIEWAELHQQELLGNWYSIQDTGEF